MPWTENDIPHLDGRVAVVTGANSGLGFETTRALAAHGTQVVLAVRDVARGQAAAAAIRTALPHATLAVQPLDLADLASIRTFAASTRAAYPRLDLLINNAGVMAIPYRRTADGFEMQMGTNHLGHFALTGLLLPALLAAPAARIVTVSSGAHLIGRIDLAALQRGAAHGYQPWRAYGQSKLANLLFAYELDARLRAAGTRAISVACHPGWAATNLQAVGPQMAGRRWSERLSALANRLLAQEAAMGALPTLYAATAPGVRGGSYTGPTELFGMRGFPGPARSHRRSYDVEMAQQLWSVSERLTGVTYTALAAAATPALAEERMVDTGAAGGKRTWSGRP